MNKQKLKFDDNPFDIMDRLQAIRDKKREGKNIANRPENLRDLVAQMHRVGKIELPYPSLMAEDLIKLYFGSMDDIDLNNNRHLAVVVVILENSTNVAVGSLDKAGLDNLATRRMAEIGAHERVEYQECILQLFLALKKKSNGYVLEFLRDFMAVAEIPLAAVGAIP